MEFGIVFLCFILCVAILLYWKIALLLLFILAISPILGFFFICLGVAYLLGRFNKEKEKEAHHDDK